MKTELVEIRPATRTERRKHNAEVVFIRKDAQRYYTIYGMRVCESWEQWGVGDQVLIENVAAIESWRQEQP